VTNRARSSPAASHCLALAAERTGMLELFHKLVAEAQNASLGRCENLWSFETTSVVLLVFDSDAVEELAYTLAKPTVAGLVKSPHDWPGVISKRFGESREVQMPDHFFDLEGALPETLTLRFVRPRIFSGLRDAQRQARLNAEVAKLVKRAREDMALRRLPFVGRNAVLRQSFSALPKTSASRRNPSPRIAAKSTPARVNALRRMLQFVRQYRVAWSRWRNGNRAVVFPVGTYALRIYARVACAPTVPT
jgi:putative transposase